MHYIRLLLAVFLIPLIGVAAAIVPFWDFASFNSLLVVIRELNACSAFWLTIMDAGTCSEHEHFLWLYMLSVGTFAVALISVVLLRLLAPLLGLHRFLLALTFAPYATFNTLIYGLIALAHIAIVLGSAYLLLFEYLGADKDEGFKTTLAFYGILFMGTLATFSVLRGVWQFFKRDVPHVLGRPVSMYEYPRLSLMIKQIYEELGAKKPDNLIIGLEPNFFVTSAPIQTPFLPQPVRGETLYISATLANIFTYEELKAVIGHEFGHFTGNDTAYSRRFAPAYRGLEKAIHSFGDKDDAYPWLLASARTLMEDYFLVFRAKEGRISRAREFRADQLGAQIGGAESIASSLLKLSLMGSVWEEQVNNMIARGQKGRFTRNITKNFLDSVRLDVDREKIAPILQLALGDTVAHPTDSHPPTEERIEALGIKLDNTLDEDLIIQQFFHSEPAVKKLDDLKNLEEELTSLYYHIFLARESVPEEINMDEVFLNLVRDFLALMVTADGEVDDEELRVAEFEATKHFGDFDREGFREACRHPEDIPDLDKLIDLAGQILTEDGVERLQKILRQIAEADGHLHADEEKLLAHIKEHLKVAKREKDAEDEDGDGDGKKKKGRWLGSKKKKKDKDENGTPWA